jgi:hypothetical protein
LVVNLTNLALCARQIFFFVVPQVLPQRRTRHCMHSCTAFLIFQASASLLLASANPYANAADGLTTVDKPMHIHRNECAERLTFTRPKNLYKFRASQTQGLFSTSGNT